jgi:hypothetical protein
VETYEALDAIRAKLDAGTKLRMAVRAAMMLRKVRPEQMASAVPGVLDMLEHACAEYDA